MEKEVLEAVICLSEREGRVKKIVELSEDSAVGPGENFTSSILRLRAKILMKSGRVVKKSYILKKALPTGGSEHLFKAETKIYTHVLERMNYLIEEFEDTEEPLWCQLIHYEPYTSMLLEDLQGKGYKMVNQRIGLDLDHGLLAIRSLGRFHGLAKVLEERGLILKGDYKPYNGKLFEVVQTWTYPAVQNMIGGIRKWGSEWKDVGAMLDLPIEQFFQNVCKSLEEKETDFKVLNHGDCWSNNIMFKYDWEMKPVSVRFIDFQNPHHSSPPMDVSQFLYFGMQPTIRLHKYDRLIENYHDSLISNLKKYGYRGPKPSIDDIFRVIDRLSYFWIYIYASWYPLLTAKPQETPDLTVILETGGRKGFRTEIYEKEGVKEKLAPDLLKLVQKNHNFPTI